MIMRQIPRKATNMQIDDFLKIPKQSKLSILVHTIKKNVMMLMM